MAAREEDMRARLDRDIAEGDTQQPEGRFGPLSAAQVDDVVVADDTRSMVTAVFDGLAQIMRTGAGGGAQVLGADTFTPPRQDGQSDTRSGGGQTGPGVMGRAGEQPSPSDTGSLAWGGFDNGRIPDDELVPISGGGQLEPGAAEAWERMRQAAAEDGVTLTPSSPVDTYRPIEVQQSAAQRKPGLAAEPGTSNHGWARAVDVSPEGREWVQQNGARFGWVWPDWARPDRKNEPWHFEFRGGGDESDGTGESQADARARFRRAERGL